VRQSQGAVLFFNSQPEAEAHCPNDTVVWVDLQSGVIYKLGQSTHGAARRGHYMCQKDAALLLKQEKLIEGQRGRI